MTFFIQLIDDWKVGVFKISVKSINKKQELVTENVVDYIFSQNFNIFQFFLVKPSIAQLNLFKLDYLPLLLILP